MKSMKRLTQWLAVAVVLAAVQGCGTLAAPQMLMLSMASTVVGGYANGAVMGGSTVGVIRNAAFGDGGDDRQEKTNLQAGTVVVAKDPATPNTVVVARQTALPKFATDIERACYFPNASGRGLPCT
jgi:hypothetical protein